MRTTASLFATACLSALMLTACAEAETETEAETATQDSGASSSTPAAAPAEPGADIIANAPDSAWRTVDAEDLVHLVTNKGEVWIEIQDEFTPMHAARIREIAETNWLDWKVFHRVIDGFMAQGGGAVDNPSIQAPFDPLQAEFGIRRDPNEIPVYETQERRSTERGPMAQAGYWNGFPVGTQPSALAGIVADGRVESWLLHCDGAAAMARTNDPNSANAQFYIVRGEAEHLNTQYTVWGKVRQGQDVIESLNVGTQGQTLGFRPDIIEEFEMATQMDNAPTVQVMDTSSPTFSAYLEALAASRDNGRLPDICSIDVPVRVLD
ncbi:peptidylprolyl isomerase [Oceanicaulis sp. LC35]|uniref:peptidylprolyl isomerase n=1 Tax=Oceanicaulis sp. LC35 TaxID=3349635 RepID=UPI003F875E61